MKKSILVLILGFVLATSYAFAETMMIEAQGIGDGYYYSYGPSRQWYGNEWWVRVTFGNYVTNLYETGYIQYSLLSSGTISYRFHNPEYQDKWCLRKWRHYKISA